MTDPKVWLLVAQKLNLDSLDVLKGSLHRMTCLLGCLPSGLPTTRVGLCAINRGQDDKLNVQMLLRPRPLALVSLHQAVAKLPASLNSNQSACGATHTVQALQSLLKHISGDTELAGRQKRITVVGENFGSASDFKPLLQAAADQYVQLDFVTILPEGSPEDDVSHAVFAAEMSEHENASVVCLPHDPHSIQQVTMRWLQALLPARSTTLRLAFPKPLAGTTRSVTCTAMSEVLPLQPTLQTCRVCPCHGEPIRQHTAGLAGQAAAGPAIGMCPITSAAVRQSDCAHDASSVCLGPDTVLHLPPSAATLCADLTSQLDSAPSQAVFSICKRVKVADLSEAVMFGRPHILMPAEDECEALSDMDPNAQLLAALCEVLSEAGEVLLASSRTDLDSGHICAFDLFYILRPGSGSAVLLAKRIVSSEELLPLSQLLPCTPATPADILQAVREGMEALPSGDFSPLDHTNGAPAKLNELFRSSLAPHAYQSLAPAQRPGGKRTHQAQPMPGMARHQMLPKQPTHQQTPAPPKTTVAPHAAGSHGAQAVSGAPGRVRLTLPPAPAGHHVRQPALQMRPDAPSVQPQGRQARPPEAGQTDGESSLQGAMVAKDAPFALPAAAGPSRLQFRRIRKAR